LPSAGASNAMNREIYAASLEDNLFVPGSSANADTCNIREFIQPSNQHTLKQLAVNTVAHSGNYSAQLHAEGVTLSTIIDTVHQKTAPYLALDIQKQYTTQTSTGLYPNGFEPYPGKKYIFDAWVNDGLPGDKVIRIALSINGNSVPLKCKAVVEGWKLMEGTMDLSTLGSATALNISIVPASGYTVYIDDIRMHPFNAQMKTYAYDDKTMRLIAEIDENGFATFYEYDEEGLLIRVKNETEKGIMTLKESRSSYRRNTQ
jgi:YD repeat-containing protein